MYSNAYIFRYASIMVILVAAILTSVALVLKPYQEHNRRVEKISDILSAAGLEADASNAVEVYEQSIIEELAIDLSGEVVAIYKDGGLAQGEVRAFDIDVKVVMDEIAKGGKPLLPLFHMRAADNSEVFVIPVRGKGLWGPIWGNIALAPDYTTVIGVSFDHKGETPGLGAEINTTEFESQFLGKKILDESGNFTSIKVVKGGVANSSDVPLQHGVDAISGGTITSNGLSAMVEDCLKNYVPFIQKRKAL